VLDRDPNSAELKERLVKLELTIAFWRKFIGATIIFLGAGTIAGIIDLYDRTLDRAQIAIIQNAVNEIEGILKKAQSHAAEIKSILAEECYDARWIDATGRCIYAFLPEGRYTLNYGSAVAACTAQGARLCSLAEVKEAYNKGAEWCAWTWVADLSVGNNVRDVKGTVVYPYQKQVERGFVAGFNESSGQNIMSYNAGAACCI